MLWAVAVGLRLWLQKPQTRMRSEIICLHEPCSADLSMEERGNAGAAAAYLASAPTWSCDLLLRVSAAGIARNSQRKGALYSRNDP